jgi:hypothetical protein
MSPVEEVVVASGQWLEKPKPMASGQLSEKQLSVGSCQLSEKQKSVGDRPGIVLQWIGWGGGRDLSVI